MKRIIILTVVIFYSCFLFNASEANQSYDNGKYKIFLEAVEFIPQQASIDKLNTYANVLNDKHVLVQLDYIPSASDKISLENEGIKLLSYIPNYAWYAKLTNPNIQPSSGVRYISAIGKTVKISPHIIKRGIADRGIINTNEAKVYVVFFSDAVNQDIQSLISKYGSGTIAFDDVWEVTLNPNRLFEFVSHDCVQWIENIAPEKETHLNYVRSTIRANQIQDPPYDLHGNGYVTAMWDGGSAYAHTDYASRLTNGDGTGTHYHATLVAGIMAGDGIRSASCGGSAYVWRGIATQPSIISYDWNNPDGEHYYAINDYGADVSQNAWGWDKCNVATCDEFGDYDSYSRTYDRIITDTRWAGIGRITIVGSAGNDGECTTCSPYLPDYPYGTLAGPISTCKNALSVSATYTTTNYLWTQSSRGPTDDGRLKPDLCAPGCKSFDGVKTTYTNNCYNSNYCGTSFASPAVSGVAIILYEQYNSLYSYDPLPSTVRNILYHTAIDLGNTGPDYIYGFGRIDALFAVQLLEADNGNHTRIIEDEIDNSEIDSFEVVVDAGLSELKATLVWDDVAATAGAGVKLVNDLDLTLISPSATVYYPWVLDWNSPSSPATTGINTRDNTEQVLVNNPEEGTWIIKVTGTAIPSGPQLYSIISDFSPQGYEYLPGDINMANGLWPPMVIGGDVTYLVNFFKGTSDACLLDGFWASADANGDCIVMGSDVVRMVAYFRGTGTVEFCASYPPLYPPVPPSIPAGWPNCDTPPVRGRVIPTDAGK